MWLAWLVPWGMETTCEFDATFNERAPVCHYSHWRTIRLLAEHRVERKGRAEKSRWKLAERSLSIQLTRRNVENHNELGVWRCNKYRIFHERDRRRRRACCVRFRRWGRGRNALWRELVRKAYAREVKSTRVSVNGLNELCRSLN